MNIGQRIWQRRQNKDPIDEEKKEIEKIIDQIDAEESPVADIDLNSEDVYKTLEEYIKTVDGKLFEIQKKYFEPNGLRLQMVINKHYLEDWSFMKVNSRDDQYDYVDNSAVEYGSKIYPGLLAAVNISPLGLILGAMWHVCQHGDDKFKIITTNSTPTYYFALL